MLAGPMNCYNMVSMQYALPLQSGAPIPQANVVVTPPAPPPNPKLIHLHMGIGKNNIGMGEGDEHGVDDRRA